MDHPFTLARLLDGLWEFAHPNYIRFRFCGLGEGPQKDLSYEGHCWGMGY